MKNIRGTAALLITFLLATIASIASEVGGKSLALSTTPTAFYSSSTIVNSVRVQVTPGQCPKIYISKSASTAESELIAILYPNQSGGISERWDLKDPRSGDGINLANVYAYVDGVCYQPDVKILISWYQTGTTLAALTPKVTGIRRVDYAGGAKNFTENSTLTVHVARAQIVPGFSSKQYVKTTTLALTATLFPNSGTSGPTAGASELFEVSDVTGTLKPYYFVLYSDIAYEGLLVSAWGV